MSYCFLSVGTVGAVRCVRTINSMKVFVEAYVTCNDAYTCAIPCAIVEVVCKYFESLLVVIAKYIHTHGGCNFWRRQKTVKP